MSLANKKNFILRCLVMAIVLTLALGTFASAGGRVRLTWWAFTSGRVPLNEAVAKRFIEKNPDVQIEIQDVPEGINVKIHAAAAAGTNPDLADAWNYAHELYRAGKLETYPENLFPRRWVRENMLGSEVYYTPEGATYTIPFGIMGPGLYYNNRLWAEAGLGKTDEPKTWEDLRAVAKKLTKRDSRGAIQQAGFSIKDYYQYVWNDFRYMMGGYMYSADETKALYNSPESLKAMEFLRDLVFVDRVDSPDFLPNNEAFGTEVAAMTDNWTWFSGFLKSNYPKIEFTVLRAPTPYTGELQLDRYGMAGIEGMHPIVFKNISAEKKEAAFKLIRYLFDDEDFAVSWALIDGIIPTRLSAWSLPAIQKDQTMKYLAGAAPYYTPTTYYPDKIRALLNRVGERIFNNREPVKQVLDEATAEANKYIAEDKYKKMEFRNFVSRGDHAKIKAMFEKMGQK